VRPALVVPAGSDHLPFEKTEIEGSIGDRFQKVARLFPGRPAVLEPGRATSYAELDAAARRIAHTLAQRLGRTPRPVGLMFDTGAPLFAAMLGVLEAGLFYVPLDPRLPAARLEAICRYLDAAALVAGETWFDRARSLVAEEVPVWRSDEIAAGPPAPGPAVSVTPDDLAYVLFTSGSTGAPKGVMQSHRNVLHNTMKLATGLAIRADDRLTLLSSPSFGASVSDIFGALLTGAAVCPHSLSGDGLRRLPEFLTREAITIYHSVPSIFRCFSWTLDGREDLSKLRVVKLGGEPVLASDFDLYRNRFPRSCLFHVGLGATEMNVIRQWFADHETSWPGAAPLGYAVDETEVALLDEEGRAVFGEGEIGVIARTLAVGYWKDPIQTAAAFLPVPGRPGVRLYRTGDLGRILPDGCLLHVGRKGSRLKIRGHSVERSEVEAALLAVPGVQEAVVDGRDHPDATRLVAWVVCRSQDPPGIADLRAALSQRLPASMVPSSFVFLEAMPRTATEKVDRQALPEPAPSRPPLESAFREPSDEAEAAAVVVFAQVLGLERVGAEDDFFELGGDSLSAVEALACLSEELGAELSAADLLEAPTPAGLAARARQSGTAAPGSLVRLQGGDRQPVFVVPGGAGDGEDLFVARRLARLTGDGFPFFCFRSGPAPHPSVEELVARCVRQLREVAPRGPYALVGDCVGGILAFAVAAQLRKEGEEMALLALLDTPYPGVARQLHARLLLHAPWSDRLFRRFLYFSKRLRYHSGVLRALPRGRLAYALRMVRVGARGFDPPASARRQEALDRRASYIGTLLAWHPAPIAGKIHLVESEGGRRRGFGEAWSKLSTGGQIVRVPGNHAGFILEHGSLVAAALRRWLESAG
jgi:amino acid adenylation domain-containing protein